jgi:hypothetical protein
MAGGVTQRVKHLPSKCEALSSSQKKKKKKKECLCLSQIFHYYDKYIPKTT